MPLVAPTYTARGMRLIAIEAAQKPSSWLCDGFSPSEAETVARCAEWATTFPRQRVKKRGRTEAICPMVSPALKARSMFATAVVPAAEEPPMEELDRILREGADAFELDFPACDPRLRCLLLVLPGVNGERLLEATSPGREIKNELLRRGILVGEFFPSCPFATTFNPRLFALRSPAPMYVFRTFLDSDWRFICQVPDWQESYRERFGDPSARYRHLGGPMWRLRQRIGWRLDAVRRRFFPGRDEELASDL